MNPNDLAVPVAPATTVASCAVLRLAPGEPPAAGQDVVVQEVPVALVFNGVSHAVMMATPADLDDLAHGFALTEGIVQAPGEIYGCEVIEQPRGIAVEVDIAAQRFAGLKERRRTLAGRTGCGLCGVDSLEAVARDLPALPRRDPLAASAVARALHSLPAHQPLFAATGAAHAAAWCSREGEVRAVREDVGRHNALDKLIGHLMRTGVSADDGFLVVTSRASYEMVQKAALFGAGWLVAVSAPTAHALALASACGMTLAGFAREGRLTLYANPHGLCDTPSPEKP